METGFFTHPNAIQRSKDLFCGDCGAVGVVNWNLANVTHGGESVVWKIGERQVYACPAAGQGTACATPPPSKPYEAWLHARLRDPELCCGYLLAHITPQNGTVDKELLALALHDIAAAYGCRKP